MNTMLKGLAMMQAFVAAAAENKKDERGAAFTEYVVLVAFVVAAFAGLAATFGPPLVTKLNTIVGGI